MNRHTKRAVLAAVISAGIITPAQGKSAIFVPQAPAIIKPAGFWKPHEEKLLLAMPLTLGMLKPPAAVALVPGYRNTYVNTAPPLNPAFAACDLGTPHATRMVVVVAMCLDANVTALNVDGTGAISVAAVTGGSQKISMWRAASTLNPTGTIQCTHTSGEQNTTIHVFALYPASQTPTGFAAGTPNILNLIKTIGGFTVIGAFNSSGTLITVTQTGPEAIIQDFNALVESNSGQYAAHHVNTATSSVDDYSSGAAKSMVIGSWL
jgi:hypothetical protein